MELKNRRIGFLGDSITEGHGVDVFENIYWNRIAKAGYKIRWFNEIVHITEYLEDGMTKNVDKNLITNWQGYSLYVKELMAGPATIKDKVLIGGAYCLRGIKKLCRKY